MAAQQQFAPVDENAQDYGSYGAGTDQQMVDMSQINYDDNGEDSFDPAEFFSSFGKGQQEERSNQGQVAMATDINTDLQVSDSSEEEEEEGADFEAVEDSQDNQDFNLDEFLQQN